MIPAEDFRSYFNYFTEVEEHFQRARGTGLFLLSPLDWALIESWKNGGVPLEAVLRGIDAAFDKWRSKKSRVQMVNSIAYCAQAIAIETKAIAEGLPARAQAGDVAPPFSIEELRAYLLKSAADLRTGDHPEIAASIEAYAAACEVHYTDLEQLEQRLTALEEKLIAIVRSRQSEEDAFAARRELDLSLKPYRGKMTADQLTMLEKQYLDRRLLERAGVQRLSLFYLR